MHAAAAFLLAMGVAGTAARSAPADPPSEADIPVIIGATVCFVVHRPQGEMTARDRVERIHYVFAKYLGGRYQEGATAEVAQRLKEITVDVKTVSLPKKVDASASAP